MNYAIEYRKEHHHTLNVTPRKRMMKNRLLLVHEGLVLVKLKKFEYTLEKGEAIWLPFDCLTSLTTFPNTELSQLDFSVRLRDEFPKHAGYVTLPQVSAAIVNKLAKENCSEEHKASLLGVIRHEACELTPELKESAFSKQFNQWQFGEHSELDKEIQLSLKVREARKQILSGNKREAVIKQLFDDRSNEFEQVTKLLLGKSL